MGASHAEKTTITDSRLNKVAGGNGGSRGQTRIGDERER